MKTTILTYMNNSTRNGIIAVAIVLVGGYIAYKKFLKPDSREVLINYLDATYGKDAEHRTFIMSADKGYVDAWSDALMKGKETFTFNNKTYKTAGGSAA